MRFLQLHPSCSCLSIASCLINVIGSCLWPVSLYFRFLCFVTDSFIFCAFVTVSFSVLMSQTFSFSVLCHRQFHVSVLLTQTIFIYPHILITVISSLLSM